MQHTRLRPRVLDSERKRVAKACQRCRVRKSRCVPLPGTSQKNSCQRCLRSGLDCVFEDETSHGSPEVETNTQRLGPIDVTCSDRNDPNSKSPEFPTLGGINAPSDAVRLHQPGRLLIRNPHQTHFVGEVSNGAFIAQLQDAVGEESPELPPEAPELTYSETRETSDIDLSVLQAAEGGLPPAKVANFLVRTFFHTVEANYYYMDREEFKGTLENWYNRPNGGHLDPSFLCVALLVFALGSQFAELQGPRNLSRSLSALENGPGTVFYLKAKLLISEFVARSSLESIQACFLMGLFLLPSNLSDLSYIYHGMAMKMAISAGLHRKIKGTKFDDKITQVRNRLWWSLYTSERRLTIILDRPVSIQEEDIDTPLPEFCQDLDSPGSEDNIANLQASIELTLIFNHVVRVGKKTGFTRGNYEDVMPQTRIRLERWLANLPKCLKLESLDKEMKSFRGAVHLHMNYNQIVIYMGRRVLLEHVNRRLKSRSIGPDSTIIESPGPSSSSVLDDSHERTLMQDCVSAAIQIIHLIDLLRQHGKLARFSFTDMNSCSAATIIIMINEMAGKHPLYTLYIDTAMRAMTFMATGCQKAKEALQLLKHLQRVTAVVSDKLNIEKEGEAEFNNQHMDFEEWEKWIASKEGHQNPAFAAALEREQTSDSVAAAPEYQPFLDSTVAYADNTERTQFEWYHLPGGLNEVAEGSVNICATWPPEALGSLGLSEFEDFPFQCT